jgi:hypothetical protein
MTLRVNPFTFRLSVVELPGAEHPVVVAAALGGVIEAPTPTMATLTSATEVASVISRDQQLDMPSPFHPPVPPAGFYATLLPK